MKHVVLIDLDVILDTRIATLFDIDKDMALDLLGQGYCTRMTDDLTGLTNVVTNEQYEKAYAARNIETLKNARLSSYIFELANIISNLSKDIVNDATRVEEPCIVINYYPYKNLDEAILGDIIYAVSCYTTEAIDIKAGYYEPASLDLKFLKDNMILTYITYSLATWFEKAFDVRKGKEGIISYPKLTVVAPKIMPKVDSFDYLDGDAKKVLQNKSPFDFMKLYWAPMFGIEFCPIELMSLIDTSIISDI